MPDGMPPAVPAGDHSPASAKSHDDPAALFESLYAELRRIARARMAKLPPGDTLQPTALVHEAYLRLARSGGPWESQKHFFATASRAMWQILVDRAREKSSLKRSRGPGPSPIGPDRAPGEPIAPGVSADELLALDRALDKLGKTSRQGQVVLLRYVAGLTTGEVAELLGVGARTVERDWHVARAFLYSDLHHESVPPDG